MPPCWQRRKPARWSSIRISAKHQRLYETLCAFANTDGGVLALGVGDAKAMRPGDKPASRLFGIEENPEGFDDFRRDLLTRLTPAIAGLHWLRLPCTLHNGQSGHVVLLRVEKSPQVHSIVGNGTWRRSWPSAWWWRTTARAGRWPRKWRSGSARGWPCRCWSRPERAFAPGCL